MKVKHLFLALAGFMMFGMTACNQKQVSKDAEGPEARIIRTETPVRPEGQKDVLNLATPKLDTVRVGFVGLGMRGPGAVYRWSNIPGTKIVALCDIEPDRVAKAQEILVKAGRPKAAEYSGSEDAYKQMCERDDIDVIYIVTDWVHHVPIALYAMEHGKHAAIEVPAATSLQECWDLVNMAEKTQLHCIMMENCVYDFFELTTLNMAQQGLFGEILHVEGSYLHNLSEFWPEYWHDWRLAFNSQHRGDVYPTHGFGPICQLLNIHRGDRLKTLVAMDTKAVSGPYWEKKNNNVDMPDFKNGDHTMTMLTTENGKTILLEHDVMNPQPYSRMYKLNGTMGFASKYPIEQYCVKPEQLDSSEIKDFKNLTQHEALPENVKQQLMEKYKNPVVKDIEAKAKEIGGHGGMDYIEDYRLVYCLRNGLPLDMDVYDLAEWCCVGELGAISIENGNAPVEVPDFTRGLWNKLNGFHHAFAE